MTDLPPGFVLNQPQAPVANDLPQGFVINGASPAPEKEFGLSDTWPVRLAKSLYSAVTLPGDVYQGKVAVTGEDGHTSPEVIERAADLAAVASPVPTATRAGAGIFAAPMSPRATPVAPTVEALEKAAKSGYEEARGLGVEVRPQPIADLGMRIGADLNEKGIQSELAPKTFSILSKIASPPASSVATIQNLEALRRSFGHAAKDFANPTEQLAAKSAQRAFDEYLAALPAEDVVRGPAEKVAKVLAEARGNYAAAQRSNQVTGAVDAADISAAAANSGQNVGNAVRQRLKSILLSDKKTAGYSDRELAQLEQAIRGTRVGNTARIAGNLLGGGGGLGGAITAAIGGVATAPYGGVGAVAPLVGAGLKKASDASVSRQVKLLDEMIRARSPLGGKLSEAGKQVPEELSAKKAAILRLMLANEAQQ